MASTRGVAQLQEEDVEFDGEIELVDLPGPVGSATTSGTYAVGDGVSVPRVYDEDWDIESAQGTVASESLSTLAKLSNASAVPKVVRKPRPGEPLDARAQRILPLVDGRTPLGAIFERAGIDEGVAVATLAQLVDLGIISVD